MIQNKVSDFLAKKNLCYDRIDRFLMFRMYEKYKNQLLAKPIIQIIGTNGKGSTGRFLAQLLENIGYNVGHYTSPHIFDFKERFYKNKGIVCKEELEQTHEKLEKIFKEELNKLSYFEYTTFLAAVLFRKCDYVIFEAGLGGEYDATSVFEKKMSIFTKIGFDHMQILGDSLEKIARTKLKVMSEKTLISSEQEEIVLKIAKKIANLKKVELIFSSKFEGKYKSLIQNYVQKYNLPLYLKHNLILALNAFEILASKEKIEPALAKLEKLSLKGRLEQLEPNLYIDVGHNVMAATALRDQFMGEKLILVYNSYQDKDVFKILKTSLS